MRSLSIIMHELAFNDDAAIQYRLRGLYLPLYRQGRAYGAVRPRLRELLSEFVDGRGERSANLRRAAWLVRALPRLRDKATRARWVWVLAQLDGELRSSLRGLLK